MSRLPQIWPGRVEYLKMNAPEDPVLFFAPEVLAATAKRFQAGFRGLVTYAVKANAERAVIENLASFGIGAFDVASPVEIALVRGISPIAKLHYNNPVRSPAEIKMALEAGVESWSVDGFSELAKLLDQLPKGHEISVRLALPIEGAVYDFGEKFGEGPEGAAALLKAVSEAGMVTSMTFHPGTQCADPEAWARYIRAAADVAQAAGVRLARLNVGGGFPADRGQGVTPLEDIFSVIHQEVDKAFGADAPELVCEPGRAMVAGAFSVAAQVKSKRECGALILNDGIYGLMGEAPSMGSVEGLTVVAPDGSRKNAPQKARVIYGPTCDSLDKLPDPLMMAGDVVEGDYILFPGLGAYATATATRFNGYGDYRMVTVQGLMNA
ncbi:MAG: ornithine decarboxylase [Rhodobacterales bacterium]|nr:MAG: ornithine decarboxylase [Rhodobacterales bacterium]